MVDSEVFGRVGKKPLESSMTHLSPFTLITQRIYLTGAVGATCFAKDQRHVIKS